MSAAELAPIIAAMLDVDNYARRMVAEVVSEVTADHWRKRAEAFEAARPGGYVYPSDIRQHSRECDRIGLCECPIIHHKGERKVDFRGRATPAELQARADELTGIAKACHGRATLAAIDELELAALIQDPDLFREVA